MNESPITENLLLLPHMLRTAGIPVAVGQSADYVEAVGLVDVTERDQVYHASRSILVTQFEQLALFETIFNRFWRFVGAPQQIRGQMPKTRPKRVQSKRRQDIVELITNRSGVVEEELEYTDKAETYSYAESLQTKDIGAMNAEEIELIREMIQQMDWPIVQRRTRRLVSNPLGNRLDQRRILRSAMKHNGIPLKLAWQQPKIKQRPIVLLADISGSMEKYARMALHFFYSVTHRLKGVESFVFGTRLTRLTPLLKVKNIDVAITEAGHQVVDWSGGTRIGESLHSFNREWSRRVVRRGALVIIMSDGWERGDVSQLTREMRYLHGRCHRLIWLNPLSGQLTYEPRVEGMSAALKYVDDFLPIHNLQSLSQLSEHLASIK